MPYDGPGISPHDIYRARQLCEDAGGDPEKLVYRYDAAADTWVAYEVADIDATGTKRATRTTGCVSWNAP